MNVHFPKLISSVVAVLALGASLHAQETVSSEASQSLPLCPEPFEHGFPLEADKYPASFNASGRIEVQTSWDFFTTGSFIYWYAEQEGMDLGTYTAVNGSGLILSPNNAKMQVQNFEYKPGFKFGLGMNFNNDNWVGFFEYTQLRSSTHTFLTPPDDARGTPVLGPILWFYASSGYLATGGINYSSIYASSLNSSWHLKLDIFDATLSRPYYQGRKLTVTPFGGMRGALIRQNLRIDSMLLYGAGSSSNAVSHNHSHCWSVGPRAGLQAHWLLSWGLRLEGDLAGSALYTQYTTVAMRSDATPSNPTVGDASVRYKNYGTIRPMTEMNLGMGWGSYFDRQNYCFDLLATYDFNVMWNQNMIRALQNTENTLSSSNAPDLYIQGLTLTARLDF